MRLRETTNEYGVTVAEYRCHACGELYTVCPAPAAEQDERWEADGCLGPGCATYDLARDVGRWFDEGRVRVIPNDDGTSRLVPYRIIEGGKP